MNRIMRSNPNFLKANPFVSMVAPRAFTGYAPCRSFATEAVIKRDAIDVISMLRTEFMMNNARVSVFLPTKEETWFFI